MTGYVLARDAWGHGYATEALRAMVLLAFGLAPVERLYAITHPSNTASERVLAKAAFTKEGILRRHTVFPNLTTSAAQDVAIWARTSELSPSPSNRESTSQNRGRPSAAQEGRGAVLPYGDDPRRRPRAGMPRFWDVL